MAMMSRQEMSKPAKTNQIQALREAGFAGEMAEARDAPQATQNFPPSGV
jgi:hypothetical protein